MLSTFYENPKSTIKDEFMDSHFPHDQSSIDGRNVSSLAKFIKFSCYCGIESKLKQVQKDGRNQGRYYRACVKSPPCGYFSWADSDPHDESISCQWSRFGPSNGYTLVNTQGFRSRDVIQGSVGDCWFLSAIAVISERSDLIRKVVPSVDFQKNGSAIFRLFIDGEWNHTVVDTYLPCKTTLKSNGSEKRKLNESLQLKYAKCNHSQLWVPLLEKAYAKSYGSYQAIHGGYICEALLDLSGAPCESITFSPSRKAFDSETLWHRLMSFVSCKFPMGAITSHSSKGIVGGHAYSILDCKELCDVSLGEQKKLTAFYDYSHSSKDNYCNGIQDGEKYSSLISDTGTLRVLRLRNPWGRYEWKGEFCNDSSVWTSKLMSILDKGDKNDGTFWLSYHDFLVHFEGVDVCKAHQNWIAESVATYTQSIGRVDCEHSFIMTVIEPTWLFVTVIQKSKRGRFRTAEDRRYWYRPICVAVIDDSPNMNDNIVVRGFRACSPRRDSPPLELQLSAGRYRIVPIVLPISQVTNTSSSSDPRERFIVRVFSSRQLIIECDPAIQSNFSSTACEINQENDIQKHFQLQLAVKSLLSVLKSYFVFIDELSDELLGLDCDVTLRVHSNDFMKPISSSIIDLTEEEDSIVDKSTGEIVLKVLCGRGVRFVVVCNSSTHSALVYVNILSTNFSISSPFEVERRQAINKKSVFDRKDEECTESDFQIALPMGTIRLMAIYSRKSDNAICSLNVGKFTTDVLTLKSKYDSAMDILFGVHRI